MGSTDMYVKKLIFDPNQPKPVTCRYFKYNDKKLRSLEEFHNFIIRDFDIEKIIKTIVLDSFKKWEKNCTDYKQKSLCDYLNENGQFTEEKLTEFYCQISDKNEKGEATNILSIYNELNNKGKEHLGKWLIENRSDNSNEIIYRGYYNDKLESETKNAFMVWLWDHRDESEKKNWLKNNFKKDKPFLLNWILKKEDAKNFSSFKINNNVISVNHNLFGELDGVIVEPKDEILWVKYADLIFESNKKSETINTNILKKILQQKPEFFSYEAVETSDAEKEIWHLMEYLNNVALPGAYKDCISKQLVRRQLYEKFSDKQQIADNFYNVLKDQKNWEIFQGTNSGDLYNRDKFNKNKKEWTETFIKDIRTYLESGIDEELLAQIKFPFKVWDPDKIEKDDKYQLMLKDIDKSKYRNVNPLGTDISKSNATNLKMSWKDYENPEILLQKKGADAYRFEKFFVIKLFEKCYLDQNFTWPDDFDTYREIKGVNRFFTFIDNLDGVKRKDVIELLLLRYD